MALLDKAIDNVVARTPTVERINNALFGAKVDNSTEYMCLSDLRNALRQVPKECEPYVALKKAKGYTNDLTPLNNKGIVEKSIPFYDKHISSSSLDMLINSKCDKVISSSTAWADEQEKYLDIDMLKEVVKANAIYGRCLINITNVDVLDYDIIEPYRYELNEGDVYIWTFLRMEDNKQIFNQIYRTDKGIEEVSVIALDQRGNLSTYSEISEAKLGSMYVYEFKNSWKAVSDVEKVKSTILKIDLAETIQLTEIKLAQFSIHIDQAHIENGRVLVQDYYRYLSNENEGEGAQPLFEPFQPTLRVEEYNAYLDRQLSNMCTSLGMNARPLGLVNVNNELATGIIQDEEKTAETINNVKNNFQRQFNDMLEELGVTYRLDIPSYSKQSIESKVSVVQGLSQSMSISERVNYLYPDKTLEEREKETLMIKYENGIPLTFEEEAKAQEYGILTPEVKKGGGGIDAQGLIARANEVAQKTLSTSQTQSLLAVMQQYSEKKLTAEQVTNLLSVALEMSKEQANQIINGI